MTTSAPWIAWAGEDTIAALGGWDGGLMSARRFEAVERELEQRRIEERDARVEARRNLGILMAHSDAVTRGLPFSPTDPWRSWPSIDQRIAEHDLAEALSDRTAEVRAAIAAGLEHLLPPDDVRLVGAIAPPEPPMTRSAPPAETAPPSSDTPATVAMRDRLTAFAHRAAESQPCYCERCVRYRVSRQRPGRAREISR
jgi:hypothetical protein